MSSYHTSFSYLNKNSYDDFNLQIVHFESGDSGETESYLSQDAIYQDSVRGTRRTMYGSKYNSVAVLNITVMRPNGEEFSIERTREINKWLTGATQYSWMDLYIGDEVKYRMHCFVQDVKPYKIDSRIVGFTITVESSSPWCYSTLQTVSQTITGSETLQINNLSDDVYTYTELCTVFKNTSGKSLLITNNTLGTTTKINNLVANEVVTLSDNMFITSDNSTRIFGNDFNYVWPKLKSGLNEFTINGIGTITFEYIYPMKVVDCVGGLNAVSDPICSEDGTIKIDMLDWNRISNTPTTLSGYGISDAYPMSAVYNKDEINNQMKTVTNEAKAAVYLASNVSSKLTDYKNYIDDNYYNKSQIDGIIANLEYDPSTGGNESVIWSQIIGKPTTLSGYGVKSEVQTMIDESRNELLANDVYTKKEVDAIITSIQININEDELDAMLAEVLV